MTKVKLTNGNRTNSDIFSSDIFKSDVFFIDPKLLKYSITFIIYIL